MNTATIRRLLSIARPYSIAYAALCCLCGLLSGSGEAVAWQYAIAIAIAPLLTLGLSAINDYIHHDADARAGRGRDYAPQLLARAGVLGIVLTLLLALLGGPGLLAGVAASVVIGSLYALLKPVALLANLVRGGTTAALVLGTGTISGLSNQTLLLAGGVLLLDAGVNMWGDLRDLEPDRRAGVLTLAVRWPRGAIAAALLLQSGAALLLSRIGAPLLQLGMLIPALLLASRPLQRDRHLWFLMLKYLTLAIAGFSLQPTPLAQLLLGLLLGAALPSWLVYRRLHQL